MKEWIWMVLLLCAVLLVETIPLRAQTKNKWTPADIFARARTASWVELEGVLLSDSSVQAVEIKFLTGDFMDDDWELKAPAGSSSPAEGEFRVLMMPVRVTEKTDFEKGIKSIEDIKPGMLLELEGTYLRDGIFLAKEIENITERLPAKPQSETKIEAIGKIASVDESKQIITVMGISFHITERTEGKSPIR
jgi:hypothetical protein